MSSRHRTGTSPIGQICKLVCLIPLLAAFGCTPEPPAPATIVFSPSADTPVEELDHYQTLLDAFAQEYPHITVTLEPGGLPTGEDSRVVDVVVDWGAHMIDAQVRGDLLDLSPHIDLNEETFDPADFCPGSLDAFTFDDETYVVPAGLDPLVIYYNQDLFDENDVPYPQSDWTWDDLLNAAVTVADDSSGIWGYGPYYQQPGTFSDAIVIVSQNGGQLFATLQEPLEDPIRTFDDPLTVEAVEWFVSLIRDNQAVPLPQEANRSYRWHPYNAFTRGQMGMWMGPLNVRRAAESECSHLRWGIAPAPRGAQSAATQVWVRGYGISAATEFPEASWQLVEFLSKQLLYFQTPARRSLLESQAYLDFVGEDAAAIAQSALASGAIPNPVLWIDRYAADLDLFREGVRRAIVGEMLAQEAMDWAQTTTLEEEVP